MAKDPIIKHQGVVRNGQVVYYRPDLYRSAIASLEGQEIETVVKKKHKRTSQDSHGYYRGGIIKTCLQYECFAHFTEQTLHEFFAGMFLKYEKMYQVGNKRVVVPFVTSMSDLSQEETNEYIERVKQFIAKQGVELLPPENYESNKYRTVNL